MLRIGIAAKTTISKEPLGPLTPQSDPQFADIVRWTIYGLIQAEEYGITSANPYYDIGRRAKWTMGTWYFGLGVVLIVLTLVFPALVAWLASFLAQILREITQVRTGPEGPSPRKPSLLRQVLTAKHPLMPTFSTSLAVCPAPIAPPRNLVVTGLYRYVRNPIYVAVVAIILGQAILFGDNYNASDVGDFDNSGAAGLAGDNRDMQKGGPGGRPPGPGPPPATARLAVANTAA